MCQPAQPEYRQMSACVIHGNYFRLSIDDLQSRISQLDILETLQSQPDKFCDHMNTYVYPGLDGKDHQMLIYYYQTMQPCKQSLQGGLTADSHVKLLKKLKPVAAGQFSLFIYLFETIYICLCCPAISLFICLSFLQSVCHTDVLACLLYFLKGTSLSLILAKKSSINKVMNDRSVKFLL